MSIDEKTLAVKNIFSGKVIRLDVHEVLLQNNHTSTREIIRHPGGVGVIPVTEKGEIYLVRQFRKPYECELLEIPAGKLEKGENPQDCGERELREETGLRASKITFLTEMYPSPGYTDEKIHIYKAEGLTEGESEADEDEFLNVHKFTLSEALEMVRKGDIKDSKSIIAILMVNMEQ